MPLSKAERAKYPKNWEELRKKVRQRSGGRCECQGECELHHGRRCVETNLTDARYANGRIVLTTAHLCHDSSCDDLGHLRDMCQRCHLRYDREHHKKNAAKTRLLKRTRGQYPLEGFEREGLEVP